MTARTSDYIERDTARLQGVHPALTDVVLRALAAMAALGYPMFVTEGVRTDERQARLFAQGRSQPGSIVTNTDGVNKRSMHQRQADGHGHAVDCAFIDDPATTIVETYNARQPWHLYGAMAEQFGMTWGGRWVGLVDRPHIEMSLSWKGFP